ncbi:hypothetical protein CPC08DRAFT_763178, partial [Agrocybe pediades]
MAIIPLPMRNDLLPAPDLNIVDFCGFRTPPQPTHKAPDFSSLPDDAVFSKMASRIGPESINILQSFAFPPAPAVAALQERLNQWSEANPGHAATGSVSYPYNGTTLRLPLWVLDYWAGMHIVILEKNRWSPSVEWLKKGGHYETMYILNTRVPWTYRLPASIGDSISDLAALCSETWLRHVPVDMMLARIQNGLDEHGIKASTVNNDFVQMLVRTYRHFPHTIADLDYKPTNFIRQKLESLKTGQLLSLGMV